MSEECTHDCGSCGKECSERLGPDKPHELSNVKKIIGVVSGKGGVGKSLVTSLCAVGLRRLGYRTAVLDADITGPSIPRMFGLKNERAKASELGLMPVRSSTGVAIMSLNLLTENETDPVVWRGPVIAGTVKQFWTDVIWGDVDFMFVDMPPGTGDVPLTVFQSLPVDGIIIVSSPQELVGMVVEKAVNMARLMNIPVLGLVENMAYALCPDCGKKIELFGTSHVGEVAQKHDLPILGRVPFDPRLASACDAGLIELHTTDYLDPLFATIEKI